MFVGLVAQAWSARPVSVAELEQALAASQSLPDGELAAQLSDLRLTERLSWARLAHWRAELGGAKSQRALLGLADRSAFLEPPAGDIPDRAAPDVAEQRRILGLAAAYVGRAIPQLPRFYATRTTTYFEDTPGSGSETPESEGGSLHAVRIARTTVQYRDGQEIVEPGPVKVEKTKQREHGLRTWGAFGPVLGLVLVDAAQNKLGWGHWEQGASGPSGRLPLCRAQEQVALRGPLLLRRGVLWAGEQCVPGDERISRRDDSGPGHWDHCPHHGRSGIGGW